MMGYPLHKRAWNFEAGHIIVFYIPEVYLHNNYPLEGKNVFLKIN